MKKLILAALALALIGSLFGCARNPVTGKRQIVLVSESEEIAMGQQSDPQVRQEVVRLMIEALAARSIEAIGGDPDHPQFLPSINQTLNVLQPNADTVYRAATIERSLGHETQAKRFFELMRQTDPTFDERARQVMGVGS